MKVNEGTPLLASQRGQVVTNTATSRHKTWRFLESKTREGAYFEVLIMGLIFLNVFTFALGTMESMSAYAHIFDAVEAGSVVIFTVEYLLRVWTVVEHPYYAPLGNAAARRLYITSFFALVDLLAIAPFYLDLLLPGDQVVPTQFIRLFRLFRLFNANGPYFAEFTMFDDVYRSKKELFHTFGFTALVVWIIMSAVMWAVEKGNPEVNDSFNSIGSSMWWTVVNLAGEFPLSSELTPVGKFVAGVSMVLSIGGIFGITASILGDGFQDLLAEKREARQQASLEQAQREQDDDGGDNDNGGKNAANDGGVEVEFGEDPCAACQLKGANELVPLRRRVYKVLEATSGLGVALEYLIFALIIANVVAFALQTMPGMGHELAFDVFESVSVIVFSVEYALRMWTCVEDPAYTPSSMLYSGRIKYFFSFFALVDFIAIFPWYLELVTPRDFVPTTFVRAVRLLRLFKADEYVGAFTLLVDVWHTTKSMFYVTGFVVLVMWVFLSALMYYTERNGDTEVTDYFQSVPGAMWLTLLNLTGEFPTGDYTVGGRVVATFIAMAAVGVFGIPVGILSGGFEEEVEARQEAEDQKAERYEHLACPSCRRLYKLVEKKEYEQWRDMRSPASMSPTLANVYRPLRSQAQARVFDMLNAGTGQNCIFLLIAINVFAFILSTDAGVMQGVAWLPTALEWLEYVSVALFTLEYVLRVWAAPADPELQTTAWPRLRHCTSFFAVVDVLAIAPFYIDLMLPSVEWLPTTMIRIVRLVRMLQNDEYAPAVTLMADVFRAKKYILATTMWVTMVMLAIFATLLHYTEMDNHEMVDTLAMAQRYESVPSGLFYTLVHLTGDYPLYQYSTAGRFVNFVMILIAAGLVGIPLGVIQQGFQEKLLENREAREAEEAKRVYLQLFAHYDKDQSGSISMDELAQLMKSVSNKNISSRRLRHLLAEADTDGSGDVNFEEFTNLLASRVRGVQRKAVLSNAKEALQQWAGDNDENKEEGKDDDANAPRTDEMFCRPCRVQAAQRKGLRAQLHSFFKGDTLAGEWFETLILALIFINVLTFVLDTSDWITALYHGWAGTAFTAIEWVSVLVFTVEYAARLYASAEDPDWNGRWHYATSFFAVVDLLAIAPFYIGLAVGASGMAGTILRVFRLVRMFKAEHYIEAFTVFDNVFARQKSMIVVTLFLSAIVWIIFATIFYFTEMGREAGEGAFDSIPLSMFFTLLFLGGEWARCDLSVPGQLAGALLCFVGIGLFSLPAGILMDGFQDIIADRQEEQEKRESGNRTCKKCNAVITHFQHHRLADE